MKKVLSVFFAVLFVFMFMVPAFAANRFVYSEENGGYIDTETGILYTNAGRGGVGAPILDKDGEPQTVSDQTINEVKIEAKKISNIATIILSLLLAVFIIFLVYAIYGAIKY